MSDWEVYLEGRRLGSATTRQAAQRLVERPTWLKGRPVVTNIRTGEEWERRGGSWIKNRDAKAPARA